MYKITLIACQMIGQLLREPSCPNVAQAYRASLTLIDHKAHKIKMVQSSKREP